MCTSKIELNLKEGYKKEEVCTMFNSFDSSRKRRTILVVVGGYKLQHLPLEFEAAAN